ncbi:alpha subunit of pyruvate dehydrogenase [Microbotryomycetes sp. JL201]|nr:alpha subunit of pyruvate dehydrogenase [Microbotryomycetes sp. JL201]
MSFVRAAVRTSQAASVARVLGRHAVAGSRLAGVRSVQTVADAASVVDKAGDKIKVALSKDYFKSHLCDIPELELEVSKDTLVQMYRDMVSMRRMEMAADQLYKAKLIRGFCHLAIGQEAVSVGMHHAIKPDDKIITAYRCHPFAVLRGGTIKGVLAELLGRVDGMSHGKGGSMHIFTPTFFGGNGIVGAQVPLGAGIAFAQQYLGQDKDHATFAMYGDGASNQGQVFEAYNMAKLWNLPCVFVNGMDVLAVKQAVEFAKNWTQSGKGPLLLEMVTYRYGGHSMSDPGTTYRTREEIQHMRSANDPITGLKKIILDWGVVEEGELKKIDKDARTEVEKAVEEAKASPEPSQEKDMWTDIYYKGTNPMYMRGREREEVGCFVESAPRLHHFAKNDSDLYEGGAKQFGA